MSYCIVNLPAIYSITYESSRYVLKLMGIVLEECTTKSAAEQMAKLHYEMNN